MTARADLPPITRKLNAQLIELGHDESVDSATMAVINEVSSRLLCAVADLENDLIIANAAPRASHRSEERGTLTPEASS
ncbi:hypothetical protein [Gordonia sp. MP11Mi]|uniref:hypothetical protein n=1 Tax=Gordonia sp. MP11Mi TaxID=3022769 RepID=UPI003B2266D7